MFGKFLEEHKEYVKDRKGDMSHEKRILGKRIVDTRKYRYVLDDDVRLERPLIKRLPIEDLDTTAAIDGWEVVKEL